MYAGHLQLVGTGSEATGQFPCYPHVSDAVVFWDTAIALSLTAPLFGNNFPGAIIEEIFDIRGMFSYFPEVSDEAELTPRVVVR